MIRVFSKKRFALMEKKKLGNYLKYAIGEIILVVIGILIALWINNWNEQRKTKQNEKLLLEKLQVENQLNLKALLKDTLYRKQITKSYDDFINYLSEITEEPSIDSLESYISKTLRTATYTFTQNNLVNFINNQAGQYSDLNRELALLENYQNDLFMISDYAADLKLTEYYKSLANDLDFHTGEFYSTKTFTSVSFKNNLLLVSSSEMEVTNMYFELMDQMKKVDTLISKYLKTY
jgi:hypothetical protein